MSADSLGSADTSKTFSSFAADIELKDEVPTSGKAMKRPCRRLRINTVSATGAIAVRYADGSTDIIAGITAGTQIDGKISAILAAGTSNLTSVTAFW